MNVFVIFAPGLGGNHLANMIATDPRYDSRASVDQYKKNKLYAHHSPNRNLTQVKILYPNWNVLCGHFGELKWFDTTPFDEKQAVIIEVPTDKKSYAYKRWQTYNKYITEYHVEEQRLLYTPELVNTVHGIADHYTINAESIVSKTCPVEQLKNMNFQIDQETCEQMHSEWIKTNLSLV